MLLNVVLIERVIINTYFLLKVKILTTTINIIRDVPRNIFGEWVIIFYE